MAKLAATTAVAAIAIAGTTAAIAAPCAGFTDVNDASPFCSNVAWINNRGVTLGCDTNLYCPHVAVSRLAMAAFLNRLGDAVLPPRVLWVANEGGTFSSIQAAIDYAKSQGASAFSTWLVKVAPGTFTEKVTMADGVDVEGSGTGITVLTSDAVLGTLVTGAVAELRHMTIRNTSSNPHPNIVSAAVWNVPNFGPIEPRLVDVELRAELGTYGVAVFVANGSGLTIRDSRIYATGTSASDGVHSNGGVTLRNVDLQLASSLGNLAQGVVQNAGSATISNSRIGATAGADTVNAVVVNGGTMLIENSTVLAFGLTTTTGVRNQATTTIRNTVIDVLAGSSKQTVSNAGTIRVESSSLSVADGNARVAFARSGGTATIAYTRIVGPVTGSPACLGTYDANLVPVVC